MSRDQPSHQREHVVEVHHVDGSEQSARRHREVQDHDAAARPKHPVEFVEPGREIGQVAHPEAYHRPREGTACEGQPLRVAAHGGYGRAADLGQSAREHREGEVGADHPAAETGSAGQFQPQIEGPGAGVQVGSPGRTPPIERGDRSLAPPPVHVEAEHMVEQVVAGSDFAEQGPHLRGAFASPGGLRFA